MPLFPHQSRVVEEKADLDGRLNRLIAFMGDPVFQTVGADEAVRLRKQRLLMEQLSALLGERINAFIQAAGQRRVGN
jgi:hypothetical protein